MSKAAGFEGAASRHLNRDLSWLEFNQRVLDEAMNPATPLLERVKFFCIACSNLDEFFEVRIASLKQEVENGVQEVGPDGLTPGEALGLARARARLLANAADGWWRNGLLPALAEHGVQFHKPHQLGPEDREWLAHYYRREAHPVLTPLAIDPAHPFPQLLNKSLNLIVRLAADHNGALTRRTAVVQAPRSLPRLVRLPRSDPKAFDYVFLADLIGAHLDQLFRGARIEGWWSFRVTRNSELYFDDDDAANLLRRVEEELRKRRRGAAVRLEVAFDAPEDVQLELRTQLQLEPDDCFPVEGPVNPTRLMALLDIPLPPSCRDPRFVPTPSRAFAGAPDFFSAICKGDILLHHPYESFGSVVEFLEQAAADPRVLAIKQTLYRTGGDERIVGALMAAVRNGKQVTAVVELKARFDEANNIRWAKALEEAGVHVVYGLVGLKIHCKMALVVRREPAGISRYLHLGTGNYNPTTGRLYTDLSLFTCRADFGEDANELFNHLTGISEFPGGRKLVVAHFDMLQRVLGFIRREAAHARAGLPARIRAKMNALVEPEIIEALYEASQAGVTVDLVIRGICCLRPGIPGLSDHINVISIIDRFLEHARIWCFDNGGQPEAYVGSADWMPRNLRRRIEVAFPVEDGRLRDRIFNEVMATQLADTMKARRLKPDGSWELPIGKPGEPAHRSQADFIALAASAAETPATPAGRRKSNVRLKP